MSFGKHTPGPWRIEREIGELPGHVAISALTHNMLAQVVWVMDYDSDMGSNSPSCEANAYLIAAAPDLLEALIDLASIYTDRKSASDIPYFGTGSKTLIEKKWGAALSAIAKARGQA